MKKRQIVQMILNSFESMPSYNGITVKDSLFNHGNFPYCLSIGLVLDDKEFFGFGQGVDRDEAAFVALMELVERFTFSESSAQLYKSYGAFLNVRYDVTKINEKYPKAKSWIGPTTSGCAIHTRKALCVENAVNELIERHVILKAQAVNIKPLSVLPPKVINKYEIPRGVEYQFYAWRGPLGRFVVTLKAQSDTNVCYGFGCSSSFEGAKEKAFFEAAPRLHTLQAKRLFDFDPLSTNPHFVSHFRGDFNLWSDEFFDRNLSLKLPNLDADISSRHIWIGKVDVPHVFKRVNLFAVQAVSPLMQPLFVGEWKAANINPLAISDAQELPIEVHMIG